jgi:hypothetical protein
MNLCEAFRDLTCIVHRHMQSRALSGASARILSRDSLPGNGMGLSRSNSVKSTHSDSAYACAQYMSDHEMPHTSSFSQIPSPQPPSSL